LYPSELVTIELLYTLAVHREVHGIMADEIIEVVEDE
jgi:hypothetical protein